MNGINVSPETGTGPTSVTMTCQLTGPDDSARVQLYYTGPEVVTFAANNNGGPDCTDSSTPSLPGTYSWQSVAVVDKSNGLIVTYYRNGDVKDHNGSLVDDHTFSTRKI